MMGVILKHNYYDKNRRPIYPGDIVKVYHFTASLRRKKHYMYKMVTEQQGWLCGCHLETKCLSDGISADYGLPRQTTPLDEYEIVQGYYGGISHDDRPRLKQEGGGNG